MRKSIVVLLLVLIAVPVVAGETHNGTVIWGLEFNQEADLDACRSGYFWNNDLGRKQELQIGLELKDGAMAISTVYPAPGYAAVSIGNPAGDRYAEQVGSWQPVSVAAAPVIELRYQRVGSTPTMMTWLHYETESGQVRTISTYHSQTEADQWHTYKVNLAQPEALGEGQAARFLGVQIVPLGEPGQPLEVRLDYVRVRRMTEEEYQKVGRANEMINRLEVQPAPRVENFFGLGWWGHANAPWNGGGEPDLERVARNWTNVILPYGSRFGANIWKHYQQLISSEEEIEPDEKTRAQYWLKMQRDEIARLKPFGIRHFANFEGFIPHMTASRPGTPLEDLDLDQLGKWADEVVAALKGEDSVLGWYIADEPARAALLNYLLIKQMMESRDRTRPALCLFNNMGAMRVFAPYQQLMLTDRYPVHGKRDPWDIATWMRDCRKETRAPHWITLETHWWVGRDQPTTPAQWRLVNWLAIAEGAKGINYFIYSIGPYWRNAHSTSWNSNMVDPYGNERPLWPAYCDFAAAVGPVGDLLVRAEVDEGADVTVEPSAVKVGMLKLEDGTGHGAPCNPG